MALPQMSGVARLTGDVELKFSNSGVAVARLNLAFNSRRLNKQTDQWEDGDTFFVKATAFNRLAENAAETLGKGSEVNVSGRLKTEQWDDANGGGKRSAPALLVDSIGPNLAYATARVAKNERDGGSGGGGQSRGGSQGGGYDDPWGSAPSSQDDSDAPF